MRVDTNSWHYRLNKYTWGDSVPQHLCPYARLLLFNITIGWWMQWLSDHIDLDIELPHWGISRFLTRNQQFFNIRVFYALFSLYGVFQILDGNITTGLLQLGICGGGYFGTKYLGRSVKFFEKKSTVFKQFSQKSVVLQSAKANHSKICPKIDFIDEKIIQFNKKVVAIDEKNLVEKLAIKNEQKNKLLKSKSEV